MKRTLDFYRELRSKYEHERPKEYPTLGIVGMLKQLHDDKSAEGKKLSHYESDFKLEPYTTPEAFNKSAEIAQDGWYERGIKKEQYRYKKGIWELSRSFYDNPNDTYEDYLKRNIIDRIMQIKQGYPNSEVKIRKKDYETDAKIKSAIKAVGGDIGLIEKYLCPDCDRW
jgi:hypothetical protein